MKPLVVAEFRGIRGVSLVGAVSAVASNPHVAGGAVVIHRGYECGVGFRVRATAASDLREANKRQRNKKESNNRGELYFHSPKEKMFYGVK